MRFKNLNFEKIEIKNSDGEGYSSSASYSKKESLKRGLASSFQILGITGFSYLVATLIRELYFSSMTSYVEKFEEKTGKIDEPIRIPSYDDEEEFYLKEFKYTEARAVFYHDIFKERLKQLPGLSFIADWIESRENVIIEEKIKEYGPSMTLRVATQEAERYFQFLLMKGTPLQEAAKLAKEYYEKLLSSPNVREFSEALVKEYIAKPIAVYKMAEMEANTIGLLTGAGLFSTLLYKTFPNKIKGLSKKAYESSKLIYKKILTGGKEEINEEFEEE